MLYECSYYKECLYSKITISIIKKQNSNIHKKHYNFSHFQVCSAYKKASSVFTLQVLDTKYYINYGNDLLVGLVRVLFLDLTASPSGYILCMWSTRFFSFSLLYCKLYICNYVHISQFLTVFPESLCTSCHSSEELHLYSLHMAFLLFSKIHFDKAKMTLLSFCRF